MSAVVPPPVGRHVAHCPLHAVRFLQRNRLFLVDCGLWQCKLARPKSRILIRPSLVRKNSPVSRSRWTMPFLVRRRQTGARTALRNLSRCGNGIDLAPSRSRSRLALKAADNHIHTPPACRAICKTARMLGMIPAPAAARASCSKRANRSGSMLTGLGQHLDRDLTISRGSVPAVDFAIPPAPRGERISHLPENRSGSKAMKLSRKFKSLLL